MPCQYPLIVHISPFSLLIGIYTYTWKSTNSHISVHLAGAHQALAFCYLPLSASLSIDTPKVLSPLIAELPIESKRQEFTDPLCKLSFNDLFGDEVSIPNDFFRLTSEFSSDVYFISFVWAAVFSSLSLVFETEIQSIVMCYLVNLAGNLWWFFISTNQSVFSCFEFH